ncbi:MAG: acyl-CoA dehydrogenase family protein [Nocardioidaceae bacterium]|nr:acyl-CoA dehydrogenase family protein [Nocardioidaceae bacterium]
MPTDKTVLESDFFGYESLLTDDEAETVLRVRAFMEDKVQPIANQAWIDAEFPHDLIPGIADLGIIGIAFPDDDSPAARPLLTGFIGAELARVDASIATFYGVHNSLAMGTISVLGSTEQQDRYLPAMRRMEKIGAFGLTEPSGGSDVAGGLTTTARQDGDYWVLNGAKRWIGNATFADHTIIWAKDEADGEVKGFVVDGDTEGFTATKIENKISLRTVQNADIVLEDCRVPAEAKLEHANSFKDTNQVLQATRGGVSWSAVGAQMGAYELARAYAVEREQFGHPIAHFQLIQAHLANMLGNVTASLGITVRVAQLQETGDLSDEQAALAKSFTTTRLRETVAWGRELFGGNGIVVDHGIARFFADAEALYSYEGTREINALIVGRAITGEQAFV